jgi:hypothetical protein
MLVRDQVWVKPLVSDEFATVRNTRKPLQAVVEPRPVPLFATHRRRRHQHLGVTCVCSHAKVSVDVLKRSEERVEE